MTTTAASKTKTIDALTTTTIADTTTTTTTTTSTTATTTTTTTTYPPTHLSIRSNDDELRLRRFHFDRKSHPLISASGERIPNIHNERVGIGRHITLADVEQRTENAVSQRGF